MINSDFEAELKIDLRLIAAAGNLAIGNTNKAATNWNSYANDTIAGTKALLKGGQVVLQTANQTFEAVSQVSQKIYNEIGVILTPAQKAEIDQAFANGNAQKVYELIEQRGITINDNTKEKIRQFAENEIGGNKFLASLTIEEKETLVQPKSVGLFPDGTANDGNKGTGSNVFELNYLYNGKPLYEQGIGTSGNILSDAFCQATGCGASNQEQKLLNGLVNQYYSNTQPFVVVDGAGFSRSGTNIRNIFYNLSNSGATNSSTNQTIPSEFIILRSLTLFDSVGSYGLPGNEIDLGKNFTTPSNTIVYQAAALNENRNNFDLHSIKFSDGSKTPANWTEEYFVGDHSDIGGAQQPNYQNKSNDIGKLTLNRAIEAINRKAGVEIYKTPSANQHPSEQFLNLYNSNQSSSATFAKNLMSLNQVSAADFYQNIQNLNQTNSRLNNDYIHSEINILKPWNWSIGSGRDTFYPNDQLKSEGEHFY